MTDLSSNSDATFERQKWKDQLQLQRDELALKARELDIRSEESKRARWSNPLVLAILGAALAGAGNIAATYYTGAQKRELERIRNEAEQTIEKSKEEA